MSKEDWIILRLLMAVSRALLYDNLDVARSITYLIKKYGSDMVVDCINQLHDEERRKANERQC